MTATILPRGTAPVVSDEDSAHARVTWRLVPLNVSTFVRSTRRSLA